MPTIIKPTVGRVVWYYPQDSRPDSAPLAAIVTDVFGDRCVNLAIFEKNGVPMSHPPTSTSLIQEGDPTPMTREGLHSRHCAWMPYQLGQAKRHATEAPA